MSSKKDKKPPLPKSLSTMGTPKPGMPVPNNPRDDKNRAGLRKLRDTVRKDKKNVGNIKKVQSAVEGMTQAGKKKLAPEIAKFNEIRKKPLQRAGGGMMKKKGMAKGGMTKKGMAAGGMMKKKGMAAGGMMKKKGMAKGGMAKKGYAMGGAMKKKGMKKGGKVRGAGIVSKGVRPAKMVMMSKGKAKGGKRR